MSEKTNMTNPAADDAVFDESIREAYEGIELSDEARTRMLNALMAHAAEADSASAADEPSAADAAEDATDTSTEAANVKPMPSPRKRMSLGMRIGLPVAACAVVAAICVVGISANNAFDAAPTANTPATEPVATDTDEVGKGEARTELAAESEYATTDAIDDMGYYALDEPDSYNTEEYGAIDESGFVSTQTSPLSTVSADVDTASYCNLRRMINAGYDVVPTGSVRIEEMLNYFTYDYDTPNGGEDFATTVQIAPCPWNSETQLMVLGFATAPEPRAADKGSNLVFLIDVSGSMEGDDRLGLLQDAFAVLTDQLDENDTISIVTYSGQEEVVLDGANGSNAREIQHAIDQLEADGSTNGEAGLRMAYDLAEKHFIDGGVNRIVMASDGDLNVGMTSESDLYDFVDAKRESGIYLSVLGFGEGNYKDNKMETIADHGNGNYHYIDCIEEAEKVFGKDLMANLVPFADDVKVQIEFNPAQVKAYRLIGYENRTLADEDFLDDTVDAGDVGPNMQFTVAYEVALSDSAIDVDVPELKYGDNTTGDGAAEQLEHYGDANAYADELLTCSLRYRAFADNAVHQTETIVHSSDITDTPSSDWKLAAGIIELGMSLRNSDYIGTASLSSAIDLVDSATVGAGADSREREDLATLIKRIERNQVRASDTADDWGNEWDDPVVIE